jgi:hypothetical protein
MENTEQKPETKQETKTEESIVKDIMADKKRYEQASQDDRTEIGEIYKVYQGKIDEVQSTPYDIKESIPKLRTEIAYVKPFIYSGQPEIEVEGVGEEDKVISQIMEKIVNYRIAQSIPYAFEKIEDWVHQATTFGTSLIKVCWKFETKKETDEQGNEFETVIKDEPDIEVPNILDCYYNPMIPEVGGQKSVIVRSTLPVEDVKSNPMYDYQGAGGLNREKLEGTGNFSADEYNSSSQFNSNALSNQAGMSEIYEEYSKDKIRTIANDKKQYLLRDANNTYGFIPLVKLVFEKDTIPNIFNGKGVGHNTLGLGKSYYKMFTQTMTNVKMCNNPMSVSAKGTKIDKRQLVSKPGGNVEVDAGNRPLGEVFQWLQFPDIKQGTIELLNKIDDEHKRASGANDLVQGAASNITLGQDQIAMGNISNRFELIQRRFKQALADLAEMLIKLELQNLQSPNASILRIFPQELRPQIYQLLINEAKDVKYNIKVRGNTNVAQNKDITVKQLLDWYNIFGPILSPEEQRQVGRRILELRNQQDIDSLIAEQPQMSSQPEIGGQPIDGQMMPPVNAGVTPQGINSQVYG